MKKVKIINGAYSGHSHIPHIHPVFELFEEGVDISTDGNNNVKAKPIDSNQNQTIVGIRLYATI